MSIFDTGSNRSQIEELEAQIERLTGQLKTAQDEGKLLKIALDRIIELQTMVQTVQKQGVELAKKWKEKADDLQTQVENWERKEIQKASCCSDNEDKLERIYTVFEAYDKDPDLSCTTGFWQIKEIIKD